ncbi:unnamed protein product [Heligmosomoides polygyrus]|uniref:CCHC-type domain-containing protein n=1 Tax=Heligmosomoides polygyrus TaxID=6339 RepID=A0A183FDT7_HELPZ|nr:unnamed protein product [Heligmosomoides polygyrus]
MANEAEEGDGSEKRKKKLPKCFICNESGHFRPSNCRLVLEQTCWGDEDKEKELRKENSSYITLYGLALAVDAHHHRCHPYAEAVERGMWKEIGPFSVFETPVPYDLGKHLTTAIAVLDRVRLPGAILNDQDIFLAVPQPFSVVHPNVGYLTTWLFSCIRTGARWRTR